MNLHSNNSEDAREILSLKVHKISISDKNMEIYFDIDITSFQSYLH